MALKTVFQGQKYLQLAMTNSKPQSLGRVISRVPVTKRV